MLERALSCWAQAVMRQLSGCHGASLQGLSLDGKTLCGSEKQGAASAHPLSYISQSLGIVPAQVAVPDKTNKITQVDELVAGLFLTDKVVTGDALLTQRHNWLGLRQVLKMERTVSNKRTGEVRHETAYAITSLGSEQASPRDGHWAVGRALPREAGLGTRCVALPPAIAAQGAWAYLVCELVSAK